MGYTGMMANEENCKTCGEERKHDAKTGWYCPDCEHERLKKEVEVLIWNLAGCDTYAMGYGLDTEHSPEMARPALDSVRRMALRLRRAEELLGEITAECNWSLIKADGTPTKFCQRVMDFLQPNISREP